MGRVSSSLIINLRGHFTVDGPGLEDTSSGGVGTRVTYISILPTDGMSCGVGVVG